MDQENITLGDDTIYVFSREDFDPKAIITTYKEEFTMSEELKEAMDQAEEEIEKTTGWKYRGKKKKNRNIVNPNDIMAVRIFNDDAFDETGKTMADLRLADGRIKRITWNDQSVALKHILMGGTIIFDERPSVSWGDLLK